MVQGALACGNASAQKEVAARRARAEVALRRRLQRAKYESNLPKNADPAELARYVMTVLQGMAVQGANGPHGVNYDESRNSRSVRGRKVSNQISGDQF